MSVFVTQWPFMLILLIACSCHLVVESKVFERCELAKLLRERHHLDLAEVAQWVCIAQHSSGFNTAAQARGPAGGSHGLFQVSDVYWCSTPDQGGGCNLLCQKLRDDDLSDDLSCIKRIYDEHQRISSDGYTAWNAYQKYCQHNAASYIEDCFSLEQQGSTHVSATKRNNVRRGQFSGNAISNDSPRKNDKVYERCELARELYNKHKMPMQQIPTWVCIAEHESRFNTAAVGRLNTDGSADHGLFQISDLYWCSHDRYGGKACGMSCSKLLDNDITDDVHCVKRIHSEHTALSGDGFTAWTVYKPYCQDQRYEQIAKCFKNNQQTRDEEEIYGLEVASNQIQTTNKFVSNKNNPFLKHTPPNYNDIFKAPPYFSASKGGVSRKGKVYTRCSLAQELYFKHNLPIQDISTWVCIAEHESQFNTAALGQLNRDGSIDHGLFQINDRYWCDHNAYGGKGCDLTCDKLLDEDLQDDVTCIKTIHEEHYRLSGDGFNAWTVYKAHCQNQSVERITSCFDEKTLRTFETIESSSSFNVEVTQGKGKIYNKCELAQELYHKHHLPMEQIPKWVCIAHYESSFNTAAVGRLNTDASADHGLFQISDLYWCNHDQNVGKACNISCRKLLDSDISDDVKCIKIIYEEHTRISGDGFNAWTVYQPHCRKKSMEYIKECFTEQDLKHVSQSMPNSNRNSLIPQNSYRSKSAQIGKIYKKCELAQELYHKHHLPMEQIPKWVCIAQHESSYNTAAVGRLNTDGSADHGLFQISDLYWCSHDRYGEKACNMPCDKLLDSDLTDDIECIKIIYEDHTRISGDGFNAWTVYKPHCRNTGISRIKECFTEIELEQTKSIEPFYTSPTKTTAKGKIYKKCELAQELLTRHRMPMEQVATWVCLAQHESSFNTAAVGRLNSDGSLDHGLFQISDLYWCSHDQYGGKACNIPCDKLLDSDITDDVECIKTIYEEHTRISGDGFNAWTVYKPHCRNRKIEEMSNCFAPNQIAEFEKKPAFLKKDKNIPLQQVAHKDSYIQNPFFNGFNKLKPSNTNDFKLNSFDQKSNYATNPFLQNIKITSESKVHKTLALVPNSLSNNKQQNYQQNPFLSGLTKPLTSIKNQQRQFETSTKPNYKNNPFLSGDFSSMAANKSKPKSGKLVSGLSSFQNNPFLSHIILSSTETSTKSSTTKSSYNSEGYKNYLNSNDFRTTTTTHKPKTTSLRPPSTFRTTTSTRQQTATTKKSTTITTENPTTRKTKTQGNSATQKPAKRPTTSTTRKPVTNTLTTKSAKKTTTWSWLNKKSTTELPKTSSTWKWQNQNYKLSSTMPPQTTTTWNWQKQKYKNLTTTKLPKTLSIKQEYQYVTTTKPTPTATTKQTQKQKYIKNNTLAQFTSNVNVAHGEIANSAGTTTARPGKTSATKPSTTTENWRKWDKTTTKKPSNTTTKIDGTAANWRNEKISKSTTTKPLTTTENWRKWDKTTTEKFSNTFTNIDRTTTNWRYDQKSTTTKPVTTTENWRKWDKTTTKKLSNTTTKIEGTVANWRNEQKSKSTTTTPLITTENWRKWDKTTTKKTTGSITNPERTTTIKPLTSTKNWREWDRTITTTTTRKPSEISTTNWRTTTTIKPTTTGATKAATTKSIRAENYKNATTSKSLSHKTLTTTTTQKPLTTKSSPTNVKDKSDPFSHPFFAKINGQVKQWHGTATTTKPPATTRKLKSFNESLLYQDFKNRTLSKSKTTQ